jgi:hypothetical protein
MCRRHSLLPSDSSRSGDFSRKNGSDRNFRDETFEISMGISSILGEKDRMEIFQMKRKLLKDKKNKNKQHIWFPIKCNINFLMFE